MIFDSLFGKQYMKQIRNKLISAAIFLVILAIIAGISYTKNIHENVADGIEKELFSIAGLKTNNLSVWYSDELDDVEFILQSNLLRNDIVQLLQNHTVQNEKHAAEHLSAIAKQHNYSNIVVFNRESEPVWSLAPYSQAIDSAIQKTLSTRKIQALGFQVTDNEKQGLAVNFSSPVFDNDGQIAGVVLFSIDSHSSFLPAFLNWPGAGQTGELILIEKQVDSLRFLFSSNQQVSSGFPQNQSLNAKTHLAVKGLTKNNQLLYGNDYRGNNALAVVEQVPNTNWYVMVKIDEAEVFSSNRTKTLFFYLVLLFFVLFIFFVFAYFYRTSQSKLYQKLFQANEEYKTTLYSIGDAVITTDANGRIKNMNSVAEKLTGWKESEALKKSLDEVFVIVNQETHEKIESPFEKVVESGVVVGLANHTLLISKDNTNRPIADSGAPIFDNKGKLTGVVVVFSDKSAEHEQEKRLEEQQRQMQTLLSNLPGMAYRCNYDEEWTMKFVSKGCLLLTGYWNHDLIDNSTISYNSLILPQYRKKVHHIIEEAVKTNKSFEIEYEIQAKNGEIKWVWEKGRAIYDDHEKVCTIEGFINDITKRVEIEHDLADSRILYKNLAQNASVGIFKTDIEGNTVYVNSKWCELAGSTETEAIGLQWLKRIHPDDRETVSKNWFAVVNEKESYATEYRFVHDDNEIVWVQGQVAPEYDAQENLVGFVGTITDITTRVKAEQTLQHNNNLLHTIIENIPDSIYMKDAMGRKVIANYNDVLICGAEKFEEIKGKTDFELFPKEIAEEYWADDLFVLKEGKSIINKKEHMVTKKGEEEWLQTSKIPLKNKQGKIVGLVGLGHNITNQVKAETEQSKLYTAIEQTPLSIIITNTDGVIEYVNRNFIETTGYSLDDAIGKKPNILKSGTQAKELYAEMWSMLKRGYDWRGEIQNKKKNGELFWVNTIITPVKNQMGETINFVAAEEDITYKKELFEELLQAKNKAEESDMLKTSFLANMSHEIRTPLNSILGFTNLLKDAESISTNERMQFSSIIEKSAESLLQIINDIIDISSLETNQLSIRVSTFNLNDLIEALFHEYSSLADKSPHQIEIRILPMENNLNITTDKNRLNQIFVNLLNNAMKFTPEGYIEFGVTGYDEKFIYFKVEDTGIGIEATHQEVIFERFRQVENSSTRHFGGNGLGLSIVKNLMLVLGGDINLRSEPGKGSCFSFHLPK